MQSWACLFYVYFLADTNRNSVDFKEEGYILTILANFMVLLGK